MVEYTKDNKKQYTFFKLNNQVNIPINGEIPLHKDKEAVRAYFDEKINSDFYYFETVEEKIEWLIRNNYIEEEIFTQYEIDPREEPHPDNEFYDFDMRFIKSLFKQAYDKKFRFKSFMGAYKFYNQYALWSDDGEDLLEKIEDRVVFNALFAGNGDKKLAKQMVEELIEQRYQPATPTYLSSGRKRRGEMVSCFLVDISEDSMLSIGRTINSALQLSRIGGGVGINLSNLRAAGDPIKGIEGASSGVVPVMKLFEDSFSYSNQLGQRKGAGVTYLNVFHPDILDFLSTKKENADEKVRVKTLSLGVIVPDKYYELLKTNEPMYLFSPHDVEKVYGKPFSYVDITKEYDNMVQNPNIKKAKYNARKLDQEISKLQQESGYPYILNIDTANRSNPIDGKIIMSNLCSEIFQVQRGSRLNEDLSYANVGEDISCNLGSLNIVNALRSPDFAKTIDTAMRALTTVSDKTNIKEVPTVQKGNAENHSVGLGAMNFHTALALNKIHYESDEAVEFADVFFHAVNYYSLLASMNIAKERGKTFNGFENSSYADGSYFNKYTESDFKFKSKKVKDMMKNIKMPTVKDWKKLKELVGKYGVYNSYRMAIAPTGSISYVNESSASLHPINHMVEARQEGKNGTIFYPAPYLSNETMPYYKSAYDTDMRWVIDVYAAAQKHIDQGMSLTLFMKSEIPEGLYEWKNGKTNKLTTRDLNKIRLYAWTKGIKSLYYVRQYTPDGDIVGANECESCSV